MWDKPKQKLVIVGDIFCGNVTFHGPFEDVDHANQWIGIHASNQLTHVVDLEEH